MSTTPVERTSRLGAARSRRAPGLLALAVLTTSVAGCQADAGAPAADADPTGLVTVTPAPTRDSTPTPTTPAPPGPDLPADLGRQLDRLLDTRATSVRDGDPAAYLSTLDQTDTGFVRSQQGYYDNLAQLPITTFSYDLQPASLVRAGRSVWVVVDVALELDGFDQAPVHTFDRFRFSPAGQGRYKLSSVTDRAWEQSTAVIQQPWDLEPITVRTGPGVLGVFDAGTAQYAEETVDAVVAGTPEVDSQVPYDWDGDVVVYALDDTDFVDGLDVPGGDPQTVDGLAFSLPVSATDPRIASTRVVLRPTVLGEVPQERDRLIRHELTHVAVGDHDDHAPVWLSEGIAEYVSVRPTEPARRRVSAQALAAAGSGVQGAPADDTFNDAAAAEHYGLAWWTCEYLAQTYGPAALWSLLDALASPGTDPDTVTRTVLGLSPDQLARRGARLLVETYRPAAPPSAGQGPAKGPSKGPSKGPAAGGPTADATASPRPGD